MNKFTLDIFKLITNKHADRVAMIKAMVEISEIGAKNNLPDYQIQYKECPKEQNPEYRNGNVLMSAMFHKDEEVLPVLISALVQTPFVSAEDKLYIWNHVFLQFVHILAYDKAQTLPSIFLEIAEQLLKLGANIDFNAIDINFDCGGLKSKNPLQIAIALKDSKLIDWLLNHNANPETVTDKLTALDYARQHFPEALPRLEFEGSLSSAKRDYEGKHVAGFRENINKAYKLDTKKLYQWLKTEVETLSAEQSDKIDRKYLQAIAYEYQQNLNHPLNWETNTKVDIDTFNREIYAPLFDDQKSYALGVVAYRPATLFSPPSSVPIDEKLEANDVIKGVTQEKPSSRSSCMRNIQ